MEPFLENQTESGRVRCSVEEIEEYWSAVVIKEPIPENLKLLVRADLKKAWKYWRIVQFREDLKMNWLQMMTLRDAACDVGLGCIRRLCNKPTAFYWLQSAQQPTYTGERTLTSSIVLAAIYEEWHRCYNADPNIEFGHFFADWLKVTETGPTTVRGVIDAHHSLCTQVSRILNQANEPVVDNTVRPLPNWFLSNLQHYSLQPQFHAIAVIYDYFNASTKRESDNFISLKQFAQDQTVLLARTGVEEGLSAPISFDSLKEKVLPLERDDVIGQDIDVIRVSLPTAVQFIVSLEVREKLASFKVEDTFAVDTDLCSQLRANRFEDDLISHSPDTWADDLMAKAEKYGYNNDFHTWSSIRRLQAASIGEDFCELVPEPFGRRWR